MSESSGDFVQDHLPTPARPGGMPVIHPDGTIRPADGPGAMARPGAPAGIPVGGRPTGRSLLTLFGETTQGGVWTLAEDTRSVTVFGETVLDLRDATLEAAHVQLRAVVAFGELTLVVPPDVAVRLHGTVIFGERRVGPDSAPAPGVPTIDVTAHGAFCEVSVVEIARGVPLPRRPGRLLRHRR